MKKIDTAFLLSHPGIKRSAVTWCNDHGINPMLVPMDASVDLIDDKTVEIQVYATDANGRIQIEDNDPKKTWHRVECQYPFPTDALEA